MAESDSRPSSSGIWHPCVRLTILRNDPVVPVENGDRADAKPSQDMPESDRVMADELYTAAEAAGILKVRESWLKTKAAARLIPCTFIGKHLRFSDDDIAEIMRAGARQPVTSRQPRPRGWHRLMAYAEKRGRDRSRGG